MKKILVACLFTVMILSACNTAKDTTTIRVSGISSTTQYLPVYVAKEKGWFEEVGLELEEVLFTNGPVQMESLSSDSWDIGLTGIGGVISGAIRYDAVIVSASTTDDGGLYVFARKDSPIVAAGQGNNTLSPEIYGSAETLKGVEALCSTGTTLQYTLAKTVAGFGLGKDDINYVAMDGPTIYSSFLAGEGDICVLGNAAGAFTMLAMEDQFVPISNARWAQTGLITAVMANKKSYEDDTKYEAMKKFLQVYYEAGVWITNNQEEAAQLMLDFAESEGTKTDLEACKKLVASDQYFTIAQAYESATTFSSKGEYSVMEENLFNLMQFFVDAGNYTSEDLEAFMNHADTKLITDIYNESK